MSLSHFRHPLDVAEHPSLEPEVKRAILASWASDAAAISGKPSHRRPEELGRPVPVDDLLDALKSLDS